MRAMGWRALPCVGLLALAAGCAGTKESGASTPTARSVDSAQERSQAALREAAEAQKRASEQAERAAQAQREVREQQDRLAQAQERLRREQEKAEQLQREAHQATRESTGEAQEAQQHAAQALEQQGAYVAKGQQTFSGMVTRSSADEFVITPQVGEPMTFRVTERTRVRVDGRESSAADIQQGGDARVAYDATGAEPTAVLVQIVTGRVAPPAEPGRTPASEPGATGAPGTTPPAR